MPLPTGTIYLPGRYTTADRTQLDQYQTGIDAYNTAYDRYQADLDAYNRQIEEWNAGPRDTDFTGVEPNAPAAPGFTQDEIDSFQKEAQARAVRNRSMMMTAIDAVRNPEAYNFGSFGFAYGGYVPPLLGGIGAYLPIAR